MKSILREGGRRGTILRTTSPKIIIKIACPIFHMKGGLYIV